MEIASETHAFVVELQVVAGTAAAVRAHAAIGIDARCSLLLSAGAAIALETWEEIGAGA